MNLFLSEKHTIMQHST